MSENTALLLHIEGTLTEKDYRSAIRARFVRRAVLFAGLVFLLYIIALYGIRLYNDYEYIKIGVWSFGEWVRLIWEYDGRKHALIYTAMIAAFGIWMLLVQPYRASKRFRELHPSGTSIVYDFYEDCLIIREAAHSTSLTLNDGYSLQYSLMRRKPTENNRFFVLSSKQRNRLCIYKALMSPQEIESVRELLQQKCKR